MTDRYLDMHGEYNNLCTVLHVLALAYMHTCNAYMRAARKCTDGRMDGWGERTEGTNGRTGGWVSGRMDGRTDRRKDGQMGG